MLKAPPPCFRLFGPEEPKPPVEAPKLPKPKHLNLERTESARWVRNLGSQEDSEGYTRNLVRGKAVLGCTWDGMLSKGCYAKDEGDGD